jgi:glycosyltransferase involved in cell wall biosynthesis
MDGLSIVIPYWNGREYLPRLLNGLPADVPVIVVDDQSDEPLQPPARPHTEVMRLRKRGYFAGAVNAGIARCGGDVLVLNQDAQLHGTEWLDLLAEKRERYALVGEGVLRHPAWPRGYVHGTFMYVRRDAWEDVGFLNRRDYPLWGCTCEWQLRACRKGYEALPLREIPGLEHGEDTRRKVTWRDREGVEHAAWFGAAIAEAMKREPRRMGLFSRTPPLVTVVIPCYNYGHYLKDAINSLVGGETCLGQMPGQTLQSFEVVIVDDASTDDSWETIQRWVDPWKGIRAVRNPENVGTAATINTGIKLSYGKYIHVLSADDMREPWALERMLRACQENPHRVAYGHMRVLNHGRDKLYKMAEYDFERLLHKNMLPAGIIYPKRAWREVGGYPEVMRDGREDWAFGIALGIHGWCGVHVGDAGTLVRREGQNRSLRTAKEGKVPEFKRRIMALYPNIYGGERPVGCCGGRRTKAAQGGKGAGNPTPRSQRVGAQGMTLLEYIGGNSGDTRWHGPETGTVYVFGNNHRSRMRYVDRRDAKSMLALRENTRPIFRLKPLPKPKEPEPQPAPESEPEDDAVAVNVSGAPSFTDIRGVGAVTAEKLRAGGFRNVRELADADPQEVAALAGIPQGQARRAVEEARGLVA